ncbi:putative lipase ROG1 family protein [Pleurotus pulmonarius]
MSNLEVALPQEINILVVFIHGFKGNDDTFAKFPERLQHTLSQSIQSSKVECIVFPAYETKGDLNEAVIRLADWLTTITVNREVASGGGAGKVRIVLCGHSMGGLLAADSLLEFLKTRPDQEAPLWPNIVACIAFDTPYLGLHPSVFKNSAAQAVEYATTAHTAVTGLLSAFGGWKATSTTNPAQRKPVAAITAPPATQPNTSAWGRWAPAAIAAGSALAAGAAAGGLYYQRDTLGEGYKWFADHMKYVGTLWNEESLKRRLEALADAQEQHGVIFRTFYTSIPATPPTHLRPRTFVVLPPQSSRTRPYFRVNKRWIL